MSRRLWVQLPEFTSVRQKSIFGNIAQYGNLALLHEATLLYSAAFELPNLATFTFSPPLGIQEEDQTFRAMIG
jgi:hypothetical protein